MPTGTKNSVIQGAGSHHIAIRAKDWSESLKLYRDVLGMEIIAEFGTPERKVVLLDIGDGSHIELFQATGNLPEAGTHPYMHFAFATNDTKASIEHVRSAGYEVTVEPKSISLGSLEVTIAFFKGPSGEELEFFQVH